MLGPSSRKGWRLFYCQPWTDLQTLARVYSESREMAKDQLTVRLPSAAVAMIDDLIDSVYGTNRADVARSLILDHLKKLAAEGVINLRLAKDE